MKILWLSWKDHHHPLAGGAEVVLRELSDRLVQDGHDVTILTARYDDTPRVTKLHDRLRVVRIGHSRYVHSFRALSYYVRRLRGKFDLVIEVVNTAPYFSPLVGDSVPVYLFYHQLARDIWFYETKFPLNHIGFHVLEPVATRLLAKSRAKVITVSESTKQDLTRYGFEPSNINIISEGTEMQPIQRLSSVKKFAKPTVLSIGALRSMKRTLDQVKAFELAKRHLPDLRMVIAGDNNSSYGREVTKRVKGSPFATDIDCHGRVSLDEKIQLMQRAHAITATSVKEGWGLVVTEAASQGTPAVVYDVDGLRDSVRDGQTGLVTEPNPSAFANGIVSLLNDQQKYRRLRRQAWELSKSITFDQSYNDFKKALSL